MLTVRFIISYELIPREEREVFLPKREASGPSPDRGGERWGSRRRPWDHL